MGRNRDQVVSLSVSYYTARCPVCTAPQGILDFQGRVRKADIVKFEEAVEYIYGAGWEIATPADLAGARGWIAAQTLAPVVAWLHTNNEDTHAADFWGKILKVCNDSPLGSLEIHE